MCVCYEAWSISSPLNKLKLLEFIDVKVIRVYLYMYCCSSRSKEDPTVYIMREEIENSVNKET